MQPCSSSSSESFAEKRLKRLSECHQALQEYPALIHRPLVSILPKNQGARPNDGGECRGGPQQQKEEGDTRNPLRIMQYNILADALADTTPKNFTKSPTACLAWNTRKERIIEQILSLDPDIICLEEVDHFKDFFEPLFLDLGYKGLFYPKKDSPCLKMENNNGPDGLALFWRMSKLESVVSKARYLENEDKEKSNHAVLSCILVDKICKKNICVAVTHFKAKKGFESLRAVQAKDTIKAVEEIRNLSKLESSVIICGDFNGVPCEEFYAVMKSNSEIELESAYKKAVGTEIAFTTWKIRDVEVKHTIDYIWYSPKTIDVVSYLAPPCEKDVPEERFPSFSSPSDHIALCCDFVFN